MTVFRAFVELFVLAATPWQFQQHISGTASTAALPALDFLAMLFVDLLESLGAEHDRDVRALQAELNRLHGCLDDKLLPTDYNAVFVLDDQDQVYLAELPKLQKNWNIERKADLGYKMKHLVNRRGGMLRRVNSQDDQGVKLLR
mmetsp:Transcript_60071/g.139932  ORF Transcript_60071/g.139932 Transcript_60071/m.139932 type:complete len:144 (+) Transcript_60071:29-460(+)